MTHLSLCSCSCKESLLHFFFFLKKTELMVSSFMFFSLFLFFFLFPCPSSSQTCSTDLQTEVPSECQPLLFSPFFIPPQSFNITRDYITKQGTIATLTLTTTENSCRSVRSSFPSLPFFPPLPLPLPLSSSLSSLRIQHNSFSSFSFFFFETEFQLLSLLVLLYSNPVLFNEFRNPYQIF